MGPFDDDPPFSLFSHTIHLSIRHKLSYKLCCEEKEVPSSSYKMVADIGVSKQIPRIRKQRRNSITAAKNSDPTQNEVTQVLKSLAKSQGKARRRHSIGIDTNEIGLARETAGALNPPASDPSFAPSPRKTKPAVRARRRNSISAEIPTGYGDEKIPAHTVSGRVVALTTSNHHGKLDDKISKSYHESSGTLETALDNLSSSSESVSSPAPKPLPCPSITEPSPPRSDAASFEQDKEDTPSRKAVSPNPQTRSKTKAFSSKKKRTKKDIKKELLSLKGAVTAMKEALNLMDNHLDSLVTSLEDCEESDSDSD